MGLIPHHNRINYWHREILFLVLTFGISLKILMHSLMEEPSITEQYQTWGLFFGQLLRPYVFLALFI